MGIIATLLKCNCGRMGWSARRMGRCRRIWIGWPMRATWRWRVRRGKRRRNGRRGSREKKGSRDRGIKGSREYEEKRSEGMTAVWRRVEDLLTGWTGAQGRAAAVAAPTTLAGDEDEPAYRPI